MIALCREMGCDLARSPRDATVMRATLRLADLPVAQMAAS
jgi:hypothetical protein